MNKGGDVDDQQGTGDPGGGGDRGNASSSRGLGRVVRRLIGGHREPAGGGEPPAPGTVRASRSSASADAPVWTDSHCHLQDDPDPSATLAAARSAGVGRVVCVGTDLESSERAVVLATSLSGRPVPARLRGAGDRPPGDEAQGGSARAEVWATIGLHPHDAKRGLEPVAMLLDDLAAGEGLGPSRVVAVGECGLDYHYEHSPRDDQRRVFAAQVALAKRHDLALVIHTREAWDDTFSVLSAEGAPERTVFHCFSGGPDEARRCLDLGASLSFSGILTFASASALREAAAGCPLDRLLVETDSPFLTPVPHRGRRNSPGLVPLVGAAVAAAKGLSEAAVADVTWENAEALFRLGG